MTQPTSVLSLIRGDKKVAPALRSDKHLLYGLYKQATRGNAPQRQISLRARSKKEAWKKLGGIPEETLDEAFQHLHRALDILKTEDNTNSSSSLKKLKRSSINKDPSTSSSEGGTAIDSDMSPEEMLFLAAAEDDVEALKILLDQIGVSIDHGDDCGQTALHVAADNASVNALKFLLERGAKVAAADQHGVSVLQASVIAGHVNIAKILLEHGADPNQADEDGDSPKMCAMDDGSPEMQDLFDDDEEDEHFEQESTISWDTEFTIDQLKSPLKIIDRIPSILDK
ncbi:hypothetical protein ACA910_013618 [Epithemia clementina (nom. ined.)]